MGCSRTSRRPSALIALPLVFLLAGCLPAPSFRMVESRVRGVGPQAVRVEGQRLATRQWTAAVEEDLRPLLPKSARTAIVTDDLVREDGSARSIYKTYDIDPAKLDTLLGNWSGVSRTAQVVLRKDTPAKPDWPGYERVEIPMDDPDLLLAARLGTPLKNDLGGSYIVVLHGLFGRQGGSDQYNLAQALRSFGHHVVLVDLRGHGDTGRRHPDHPFTFGLDEPRDLLAVSRWLRSERKAKRVGLVGFSITAQQAMLAAWLDGDMKLAGNPHSPILEALRSPDPSPQFDAGIIAISPALNLSEYADSMDRRYNVWESPVRAVFQSQVEAHFQSAPRKSRRWRMWEFMKHNLRRSRWMSVYPDFQLLFDEDMRFVNLCGPDSAGAERMECVRVPLLVVHAADDPVEGSAQAVADVFAQVRNANCGVIMLRRGGHTGVSAFAPVYYYSLVRSFFDPRTGPRTVAIDIDIAGTADPARTKSSAAP